MKKKAPLPPLTSSSSSFLHSSDQRSSSVGSNDIDYYAYPSSAGDHRPKTGTHKKQRAPPPPRQIKLQPLKQQLPTATTSQKQQHQQQEANSKLIEPVKTLVNNNNSFQSKFQFNSIPRSVTPRTPPTTKRDAPSSPPTSRATVCPTPPPLPPPAPATLSLPCPPPPPPPATSTTSSSSSSKSTNKVFKASSSSGVNPREELMMAIRNSGGLRALKPIKS